jgi:NAD(P)-dependent dehydrogenase (short-subunit alcohol dehydrogenase family)
MRLHGKVALITGSGSGMGRASAILFASEGAKVVGLDVDEQGGNETAARVRAGGGESIFVKADVAVEREVAAAVEAGVAAFGHLDVLFNNAGVLWRHRDFEVTRTNEAEWDRVMAINLKGPVWVCKYGIPELIKRGGGSVITTGSVSAIFGYRRAQDAYTSAKGALISLTRSLAVVYGDKKIRANIIHPGMVDTPMQRELNDEVRAAIARAVPLGRMAQPEDIARVALFLASDESAYITGAEIVVDGGLTITGG